MTDKINEELNAWMTQVPEALHAAAVVVKDSGLATMNELFFRVQSTVEQMFKQLSEQGVMKYNAEDSLYSFMTYGFPRTIPNLLALDVVLVKMERFQTGPFMITFEFVLKGDSRIVYNTRFVV